MAPPAPRLPAVRFEPCPECGAEVTGYTPWEQERLTQWPDGVCVNPSDREVTLTPCGHTAHTIRIYSREQ